jgi:hypothetical protein
MTPDPKYFANLNGGPGEPGRLSVPQLSSFRRAQTYSKNAVGHHRRRLSRIGESVPTNEVTRTMKMAPIRRPSLSEEFVVVQDSGVGDAVDISF